MKIQKILLTLLTAAVCFSLAACSIKFGFVDESSSEESSRIRSDNSLISEILGKGYSSTDMGESYSLDGDFSMLELHDLDDMPESRWLFLSDNERYDIALNFLNFWAYYGDDASIRFKPSELVSGITETLSGSEEELSVLDAALDFAVAGNKDKYLTLIGVIDIDDIDESGDTSSDDGSIIADEDE